MRASIRHLLLLALAVAVIATATGAILAAPAGAAPFTSPDGLWTWSRPLPHGYPGYSISAAAPGELFAVTSVGEVLATTDGGASWGWSRTSAVSGFAGPQDIQFVSATEGWTWGSDTTGNNGMLLRTTDEGTTWQASLTMPSLLPLAVRFSGPATGWVVGSDAGQTTTLGQVLYTTTDGGQTWNAPVAIPQDDNTTFAAFAPQGGPRAVLLETLWSTGAGNGDIVGTRVYRTTDGGATWLAPTLLKGVDLGHAAFSSATKGWATDGSWLWRTTNGGASWHKVHRAPGYASVTTVGNAVWVVNGSVLHSSDGGKTWKTLRGLSISCISFSDPLNGWAADGATYLRTTDGGRTWQHVTPAPKPWGTRVSSLAAVGGETVWGAAGRVIRTTDGGQHWRFATKRRVRALAAVSARQAWAVGPKGLIIHTADGGHHWKLQPSGVNVGLGDVFFLDARHGWAGGGRTLLRTIDGGRHWTHTHEAIGALASVAQLDFADARHGIALTSTNSGVILVTNNGGRTWAKTRLPVSSDRPTAVTMEDASHALIITYSFVSLHPTTTFTTSDGGKTWQPGADLPIRNRFVSIARSGSLLCAVGDSVVTSRNDGVTWSDDGAPSGGGLTSVQFVGADTLMIGGYLGILTRNLTTAPLP